MNAIHAATEYIGAEPIASVQVHEFRVNPNPIGRSRAWLDVLKQARQVAATETTVCLQGESGTGKEVLARFIHHSSPRRRGPFVAINCAAVPEHLFESELFGFERGAFTGALQPKPGQLELAAGGVLFLDEVTEMTPAAQAKLLRVLQEREFQRLGGTRPIRANVRVIVATNRDLWDAVAQGRFRADLYYRVHVFDIQIPPLRDRREDIVLFAESLLDDVAHSMGRVPPTLTEGAKGMLLSHAWPGNVRELRNVLERATIMSEHGVIDAGDLSLPVSKKAATDDTTDLDVIERETIQRVIHEVKGNKTRAARKLGLSRTQLYLRLRKHGFECASA